MQKIIWMFWLQGWDSATELSKICLNSWERLNPEWKVIPLSKDNLSQYLNIDNVTDDFYSKKPISCTVDIINLNLLSIYGGIWIDSTVMCLKPLDCWLLKYMTEGFFAHKFDPLPEIDEASGKTRLLSTWFIAANKNNYIIDQWCSAYNKYWMGRERPTHYFDFHYLFFDLYNEDKRFKKIFDRVPSKNAQDMHYLDSFKHEGLAPDLKKRVLNGEFELTKFQNVYENKTYEGEDVVKSLLLSKHQNHLNQSVKITGLKELQSITDKLYFN